MRRFHDESEALARIDHPGVVGALDSGTLADGRPFLVMQFIDGVTLRTALSAGRLPLNRASSILRQIGHALGAAHRNGIIHRDLKPENIMLQTSAEGDRARLIDFGIARLRTTQDRLPAHEDCRHPYIYAAGATTGQRCSRE